MSPQLLNAVEEMRKGWKMHSQGNLSIGGKLHEAPHPIALALSRVESKPLLLRQAPGTPASMLLPLDGLFVCF